MKWTQLNQEVMELEGEIISSQNSLLRVVQSTLCRNLLKEKHILKAFAQCKNTFFPCIFLINKRKVEMLAGMRKEAVRYPRNHWHRMPLGTDSLRRGDSRPADNHTLLRNESILSLSLSLRKK